MRRARAEAADRRQVLGARGCMIQSEHLTLSLTHTAMRRLHDERIVATNGVTRTPLAHNARRHAAP
jgi:hypothetical protein